MGLHRNDEEKDYHLEPPQMARVRQFDASAAHVVDLWDAFEVYIRRSQLLAYLSANHVESS